jgi:diamine N-acetyltransferase
VKLYNAKDYKKIAGMNEAVQNVHAEIYPDHFKEYCYKEIKHFLKILFQSQIISFSSLRIKTGRLIMLG